MPTYPGALFAAPAALMLLACDPGPQAAANSLAGTAPTGGGAPAPTCRVADTGAPLPMEVRETSGLARSRRDPNVFWTHNDAGSGPDLYALGAGGELLGRVTVEGAESVDWEDLEAGPCDGGSCLYVGDIGDNDAERESITIYEIPEPEPGAARAEAARVLLARFPDGARDAEALFVLPSGDLYIVSKGREGPVVLYRYPAPHRPGETVTLERVRELRPEPSSDDDRVTSATATPDGRWVGMRTYRTLLLFPAAALTGSGAVEPARVDLTELGEAQGESLVIADDGTVWLSSEAARKDDSPTWARLACDLPDAGG